MHQAWLQYIHERSLSQFKRSQYIVGLISDDWVSFSPPPLFLTPHTNYHSQAHYNIVQNSSNILVQH